MHRKELLAPMELPSEFVVETRKQMEEGVDRHFHVLAVDDSVIDRKILATLLQKVSSYRVTCVDSGDEALRYLGLVDNISNASSVFCSPESSKLEGIKVNLIMTDYCMPGMSGYDLLKRLKGSNSWKDVPVVVMSSENVPSIINMCMEEGAEEFLLKPIQLSDLEKLQPHLSKSSDHSQGSDSGSLSTSTTDDNDNGDSSSDGKSNNGCSKRKAVSPDPVPEIRRPKTK